MQYKIMKKGARTQKKILCSECGADIEGYYFEFTGPLLDRRRTCPDCVFKVYNIMRTRPPEKPSWFTRTSTTIRDYFRSFAPAINRIFG